MSAKKKLEDRIKYRIKRSIYPTFVLSDFSDLSDRDQILRALRKLIKKKLILRVGQGVYVRTKISSATKKIIPEQNIRDIAITALNKSGIEVVPTLYEQAYNDGNTTQVPTGIVIGVKKRVNKKSVSMEDL
jgi:hypothetical protein